MLAGEIPEDIASRVETLRSELIESRQKKLKELNSYLEEGPYLMTELFKVCVVEH